VVAQVQVRAARPADAGFPSCRQSQKKQMRIVAPNASARSRAAANVILIGAATSFEQPR
jgi:hypothetical protein